MTIWILALVLLLSLAGLGYRQGAIRVAFSLVGILFATLLAVPLGKLCTPVLKILGMSNPLLLWAVSPFVVFCLVLIAFKIGGVTVHQKVDVFYKYKTSGLRQALWERINRRLGLCLGLVNGLAYLVLIAFVIFALSYWTVQVSASDGAAKSVRLLNQMGRDLQSTGMSRVAGALSSLSPNYFEAADIAGLLYHQPLLEARLSRYPGLLALGEGPEFQALGRDETFADLRQRQQPVREILALPSVQAITKKPETLRLIWSTILPDLKDLGNYLTNGVSLKYDVESIVGRWKFNISSTIIAVRRAKPNLPMSEVQKVRAGLGELFNQSSLVATPSPDQLVFLKNLPAPGSQPGPGTRSLEGKWQSTDGGYTLSVSGEPDRKIKITGSQLSFEQDGWTIVFEKEY